MAAQRRRHEPGLTGLTAETGARSPDGKGGLMSTLDQGLRRRWSDEAPTARVHPSPADALYLVGEAVLIAGLLSFPSSPTSTSSRSRVTIDGLVIGVSLLYICWAFGLGTLYTNAHIPFLTGAVALAYPVADMVMV